MLTEKLLLRVAGRFHEAWLQRAARAGAETPGPARRLAERLDGFEQARRRLGLAVRHRLSFILPRLREEALAGGGLVQDALTHALEDLDSAAHRVPPLAHWAAELRQLRDEFEDLAFDGKAPVLTVTTEPITLEGIDLGPFALRLPLARVAGRDGADCFEVVALEPNSAAANEAVTHPHVRDDTLCAGDAAASLRLALDEGRLADAFCLVRGVLGNYNPHSAYVALESWEGTACHDCGQVIPEDDRVCCNLCDTDFCVGCTIDCAGCGVTSCLGCSDRCAACGRTCCGACRTASSHSGRLCCENCLRACQGCGSDVADDELDPETKRCPDCQRQAPVADETDSDAAADSPSPSNPSLEETDRVPTLEPAAAAAG
jgi:hypothetical protein